MKTSAHNGYTMKSTEKLAAWLAGATLAMAAATGAFAQDNGQTGATQGGNAVQPANPSANGTTSPAPGAASQTKAQRKAAQKQARKEARAKRNAELKQLEENGYEPGRDDPNYPQNLQNAQRKAGIGQGASQ